MSNDKGELYVITSAKKLNDYISDINENCPKKYRYSIISKVDNTCLEIISLLYLANSYKLDDDRRKESQREVKVKLQILDYYFLYGVRRQCYTSHQYEVMSKQLSDCLNYLSKWIMSDANRLNKKG